VPELVLTCAVAEVPFPAFETLDDRIKLPRRYFLFFDLFFRAGRHNRVWWKDATSRKPGEKTKRFGNTMIEAHVKTTIRENYFRWMFQILSDPRCIPEHDMAFGFKTEYDCNEPEDFPEDLACSLSPLARLPKTCEIGYLNEATAEEEPEEPEGEKTRRRTIGTFTIFTEETEEEEFKSQQQEQRELIMLLANQHGKEHTDRLKTMRQAVRLVRMNTANLDSKVLKHAQATAKKKLKLYTNDEERPKKKRRKSVNKCADKKIKMFDLNKKRLDREERYRYREAWEVMYKKIMKDHAREDSDDEEDKAGRIKGSVWIADHQLDVDSWDEV
jgi:hypothetical protein